MPGTLEASDPLAVPLDDIDLIDPELYRRNLHWPYFDRLRREDPVHFHRKSNYGPFWSITTYRDILYVDSNHELFSSEPSTALDIGRTEGIGDDPVDLRSLLVRDPPRHDQLRKAVTPAVAPSNSARLEATIRERTRKVLDELPIGEEFDWVPAVSIELTTLMLATLMDYPLQEKSDLTFWSDVIVGFPGDGIVESWDQRNRELHRFAARFNELREERRRQPPRSDLISMMAHAPESSNLDAVEFVANMSLLIVGGNDTTRNTMSGSVLAFDAYPGEWDRLMSEPALVNSMVPEAIRWQTPVIYQARTALCDTELSGKTIRKGDRIAMWYISGNRDPEAIERPEDFIINRPRPRQHLSFGFGIHRCLGNRLAEMQLRVLWEEIITKGWKRIEVTGTPIYAYSNVLRGINSVPVRIHA